MFGNLSISLSDRIVALIGGTMELADRLNDEPLRMAIWFFVAMMGVTLLRQKLERSQHPERAGE